MTGGRLRRRRAVLASNLERLDSQACRAFVADVWAARGFETTVDGRVVSARRRGRTTAICTVCGRWSPASRVPNRLRGWLTSATGRRATERGDSVDVVVSLGNDRRGRALATTHGARHVDSAAFLDLLLYGLDRTAANRLCERHLGAPIDGLRPPLQTRTQNRLARSGQRVSRALRPSPSSVAVFVVFVLVVSGGAVNFGLVSSPAEWPVQSSSSAGSGPGATLGSQPTVEPYEEPTVTSSSTPAADSTTRPPATPPSFGTEMRRADLEPLADGDLDSVPGVAPTGITNLTALSDAHDEALSNRSYTLWLDTYQPRDEGPNSTRVQYDTDVVVAEETYLIVENVEAGRNRARLRTVYYDGDDWYVTELEAGREQTRRVGGNATSPPIQFEPRDLNRALVSQYLATRTTNVTGKVREGNTTYYRVVGERRPSVGGVEPVRDYRFVAYVDDDGFVSAATVTYGLVSDVGIYRVRFEWTYGALDSTTVDRPAWVALNETAEGADQTTDSPNQTAETPNQTGENKPPSLRG